MKARILTVDDREGIRLFIKEALVVRGYHVDTAVDGVEALSMLKKDKYQLVITDLMMPRMDGMELLENIKKEMPEIAVVVLTAHATVDNAVLAMKMGAFDYLTKPLDSPEVLRNVTQRALANVAYDTDFKEQETSMVVKSPVMLNILEMIKKVARTDATVMLYGHSGTGKEVTARDIHKRSLRNGAPFIAVNCAAITSTLVESEMFGHEKGAFTGATEQKKGRFEVASGGTLFLDEVGELPILLQSKLLRVIQERTFERVGGITPISVDVRIIAATNRDLKQEISKGTFREDLYHRLFVFPIYLPPLKERIEDIEPLVDKFLTEIAKRLNLEKLALAQDALSAIKGYSWPGNIRELGNVLERAAIMCSPPLIEAKDLGLSLEQGASPEEYVKKQSGEKLDKQPVNLKDMEKKAIEQALEQTDGHRKRAAKVLGIGLRTLYNKIREYDLD